MSNTIDFEQARRKRQRARRVKQFAALAGVLLVVLLGVALNNYLVQENATVLVSDIFGALGGSGYPVNRPGGTIQDVKPFSNNLVLMSDTNLYIYNPKGKILQNIQRITTSTAFCPAGDRLLYWQIGAKSLSLASATKVTATLQLTDNILCADLGDKGDVAVVTLPKQYVSQISVYSSKLDSEPFFRWYSTSNIVSQVSLSPKGDSMVAGGPSGNGGNLESVLYFFSLSSDSQPQTVILPDELLLSVDFFATGQVAVLTDRAYRIYDRNGRCQHEYALPEDMPLAGVELAEGNVLLYFENSETRTQQLVLLNRSAQEQGNMTPEEPVADFALNGRQVYLLYKSGIATCSHSLEQTAFYEESGVQEIALVGRTLYYFTRTEINTL